MKSRIPASIFTIALMGCLFMLPLANLGEEPSPTTFVYDWAKNGSPYQFVLLDSKEVIIRQKGKVLLTLHDDYGIAKYSGTSYSKPFKEMTKMNILKSEYLLMLDSFKGKSQYPLLMVFGEGIASDPGAFHVIALSKDGTPHEIMSLENFYIEEIVDLNNDGIQEIIGKKCLSQLWGACFSTYDPFSVYCFGKHSTDKMKYKMTMSRSYNKKHYYGWAGPNCREDVAVVLHPKEGGKPIIIKAQTAEKIFE
jgi:hypothetical protein